MLPHITSAPAKVSTDYGSVFLLLAIAFVCLWFGWVRGYDQRNFLACAIRGQGKVIEVQRSTRPKGGVTYAALFIVVDEAGKHWPSFSDDHSSPVYRRGDMIPVFYLPDHPDAAVTAHDFYEHSDEPSLLAFLGFACILAAAAKHYLPILVHAVRQRADTNR